MSDDRWMVDGPNAEPINDFDNCLKWIDVEREMGDPEGEIIDFIIELVAEIERLQTENILLHDAVESLADDVVQSWEPHGRVLANGFDEGWIE